MSTNVLQDSKKMIHDEVARNGLVEFGTTASYTWRNDPRHLLFTYARYKFVAKMLEGKGDVLEVGCGDGFCLPIMLQTVDRVHGIDLEQALIDENNSRRSHEGRATFEQVDLTESFVQKKFDATFSLDVIEHIPQEVEQAFIRNTVRSLKPEGVMIMGTPNVTAAPYASPVSEAGHINLKSGAELKQLLDGYFHNTFLFGMNDEVVHTGYSPMAHYVIAMGVGVKPLGYPTEA